MNDWSRLAVDPRRCKNSKPKNELYGNIDTLPRSGALGTPCQGVWANNGSVRRYRRGQLRLSLTNTYHEWPVINANPLSDSPRQRGLGRLRALSGRYRHVFSGRPLSSP